MIQWTCTTSTQFPAVGTVLTVLAHDGQNNTFIVGAQEPIPSEEMAALWASAKATIDASGMPSDRKADAKTAVAQELGRRLVP